MKVRVALLQRAWTVPKFKSSGAITTHPEASWADSSTLRGGADRASTENWRPPLAVGAPAAADEAEGVDVLRDPSRFHLSLGPALQVPGSFSAGRWGAELTFGRPLFYGPGEGARLVLDAMVSVSFAPQADFSLVTTAPVVGVEFVLSRTLSFDFGIGLGFTGRLGAQSALGFAALAQAGLYLAPFEDRRRRFKLEVRDITSLLATPVRITPVILLSGSIGFETSL